MLDTSDTCLCGGSKLCAMLTKTNQGPFSECVARMLHDDLRVKQFFAFTLLCLISLFHSTFKVCFIAMSASPARPRTKRAALRCDLLIKQGGLRFGRKVGCPLIISRRCNGRFRHTRRGGISVSDSPCAIVSTRKRAQVSLFQ